MNMHLHSNVDVLADKSAVLKTKPNMSKNNDKRVTLLGLDFGSTTSSALIASAVISNSATGRMAFSDIQIVYRSEPVLTPFLDCNEKSQRLDINKITQIIQHWLAESNVQSNQLFSGGSMITGLAAQAENAAALSTVITQIVGESVIATADDPCLESWLAFKGSCDALSRYYADVPILNIDIGGGTSNIALGLNNDIQQTGCYFIGARHFQFVAGSYQLTVMSSYGKALLAALNIKKAVHQVLSADEIAKIMAFYVDALEAIVLGELSFFESDIAQKHTQVTINLPANTKINITFSGGVGELIYKISANQALPTKALLSTTYFGDFGIDLAQAICNSPILCANLTTCTPENKGRATLIGLTLHATEIAGNTIHLPNPNYLPLRNLPIIANLNVKSSVQQWQHVFALAAKCQNGACLQITATNTLDEIRALAQKISDYLGTSKYAPCQPLLILVETNIGKALGNYISNWGQHLHNVMVIDEVPLRSAHFVHVGRLHQQMIPVSFYGLH